jgi:hypothetical protein
MHPKRALATSTVCAVKVTSGHEYLIKFSTVDLCEIISARVSSDDFVAIRYRHGFALGVSGGCTARAGLADCVRRAYRSVVRTLANAWFQASWQALIACSE